MKQTILRRNNVRVVGESGPTMLFAHGFGCDQNMWRFVAPAFAKEYRLVLFDYVGSGHSDLWAYDLQRYSSLTGYAEDVLEICGALELQNVVFVGHSVSSMIGLLASIQRPELFDCLIMIGPSPCYLNQPPDYRGGFERKDLEDLLSMIERNYLGWASFFAPVVVQNPDQPELVKELEESFCSTDPKTALRFAETTFFSDNRDDLPKAQRPSLLLQATDDVIAPLAVGEYLHRHLPGSTLRVMEATGHCPHLTHPAETIRLIREFLMGRGAGGR